MALKNIPHRTIVGSPSRSLARLLRAAKARPKIKPLKTEGYAYFVGPVGGPIKIGYSRDPEERLYKIQTDHPERLHLWAMAAGGEVQESAYHSQFSKAWIGGEWFHLVPEIEAEITRLSAKEKES